MTDGIPVAIIGAGPFGLSVGAHLLELRDMGPWPSLRGRRRHGTPERDGSVLSTGVS